MLAGTSGAPIDSPASVTHASEPKAQLVLADTEKLRPAVTEGARRPNIGMSLVDKSPDVKQAIALGQRHLSEATQQAVSHLAGALQRSLQVRAKSALQSLPTFKPHRTCDA